MNLEKGHSTRILSIDIMRGFTLLLMLFVNDLYEPGVPFWLLHAPANVDSMGLADWVFPGFLFMVGVSVPYAIRSRLHNGESELRLMGHIIIRTISLLLIGVYMVNIERLNEALTGMNKYCWAILLYLSIFLIWNNYPRRTGRPWFFLCLKGLGLITMIVLAAVFKAGESGKVLWLATSWWGILGLIGWGYFVATLAYLLFGERKIPLLFIWGFFIGLNILSKLGILTWSGLFGSVFDVVLEGSIPSIVLVGVVVGVLIRSEKKPSKKILLFIGLMGVVSLVLGIILRHWFILSKIDGTPSWVCVCNGISLLVYACLYFLIDIRRTAYWGSLFQFAGRNSLTIYLAPDIIYFSCWGLGIPFFYKQSSNELLAVGGSVAWAFAMIGLVWGLTRMHVRLKL